MKLYLQEIIAVVVTVSVLVGMPVVIFQNGPWVSHDDIPVIHLTGVMKSGTWTNMEVTGLNYWWKSFKPATIQLNQGDEVLLRLSSSDGTHSFYIPELGLGPIQVEAGHTRDVMVRADKSGDFTYYCITVCGECHYYMRGLVHVSENTGDFAVSEQTDNPVCKIHEQPAGFSSFVEQGKYLFTRKGCATCHGDEGKGGVHNANYIKGSVPSLNDLADKMKIYWEEDADTVIKLLGSDDDFKTLADNPPIDNYSRFLAQYESINKKIMNGSPVVQKLDSAGPRPPLAMPAWEEQLSKKEINSILAYLISLFPWEDYE